MAISFVASASRIAYDLTGTFVCNKPTGTVQGDTMITFLTNYNAAPISAPSGWTQAASVSNSSNNLRSYIYYKLAGASEPSSYSWGLDPGLDLAAGVVIHTYRGVDIANPVGTFVTQNSTTLETLASGNVNVAHADSWLIGMSSCRHAGTSACSCTAASLTERVDGSAGDTAASFSRATATYDSGGTVATGNSTRTFIRSGTTTAHNVVLGYIRAETDTAKSGTDTGTGADAGAITATFSQADTGSGAESTAQIVINQTEAGSGVESQSLLASQTRTDTGSGVDSGAISSSLSGSDTGSGLSAQSILASLAGGDTGGGVDDADVGGDDTPTQNDDGSFTETFVSFATFTGTDTGTFTEGQAIAVPPVSYDLGDYGDTLVMGPAALYIGAYGALEPALGLVGSIPDPGLWTPLGGTLGGVELAVDQEFKTVIFEQLPDTPFNRLEKRYLTVKTPLAETTLSNLALALNDSAGVTGTEYTPTVGDSATPLVYRALIVDGWAPGVTAFGRHKRRRVIVRKCLSVDNVSFGFNKEGQTVYTVSWSCHHVDDSTAPFRVIDEA